MKTPILNTAIAVIVASVLLAIFVPQLPSKGGDAPPGSTCIDQFESNWNRLQRARADAELERLDENCSVVEGLLDALTAEGLPDDVRNIRHGLESTARKLLEQTKARRGAFQRVADGDVSAAATTSMENASTETLRCANEVDEYANILDRIRDPQKWAHREEQERLRQRAEEEQQRTGYGLGMTTEGYQFLKAGMSMPEVGLVLGCTGVEQSRAGGLVVYAWQQGTVTIVATFDDWELVAKSQYGL